MTHEPGAGPDHRRTPPWSGEVARLVTRHGKEVCVAPALAEVGLGVVTAEHDTDALGTFTGSVPRPGTAAEVAVRKAALGLRGSRHGLGVASEGSFGPHPAVPLGTADDEVVVLLDRRRGLVVQGRAVRPAEVAVSAVVGPQDDLAPLLARADLPRHRLTVRPDVPHPRREDVTTGIGCPDELVEAVRRWSRHGRDERVVVSTDFRAHVCPSRRVVIAAAAADLAHRLGHRCPRCRTPGWGVARLLTGAPCRLCGRPTRTVRAAEWACPACAHRLERLEGAGRADAEDVRGDPATCDRCNP